MSDADVVERIRSDPTHGASWLAREAARGLAEAAGARMGDAPQRVASVRTLARQLALARPSMAAIAMMVAQVWWAGEKASADPTEQVRALREAVGAIEARWLAATVEMSAWVTSRAPDAVITLSRSGSVETALTSLARARASTKPLNAIVCESRPGGEGVALADALAEAGAEVTLIPDSASASFMQQADVALVGADSIRADGSVVNKVGTHTLAIVAKAYGRPVYALAESVKVTAQSYPLVLEEAGFDGGIASPHPEVRRRAPLFDVTPRSLIAAVVTEVGPLSSPKLRGLASQAEEAYTALMRLEEGPEGETMSR